MELEHYFPTILGMIWKYIKKNYLVLFFPSDTRLFANIFGGSRGYKSNV